MKALFECIKCKYLWEANPGPTVCVRCGHSYVRWLNYDELRDIWNKERIARGEEPI